MICSTKVSEKSDMAKFCQAFCCSGTYKQNKTTVLRNLGDFKMLRILYYIENRYDKE